MRIVEICTNAMSGSVGRIARDISDKLENNGHKVLLCYGRGETVSAKYESYRIGNTLDVYSHALMSRLFDSDGKHSKKATKMLIKKLKEFNPDCIHIHCLHGYYINIKILFDYINDNNIRVVWTFHDCWAFTGHCAYFSIAKCNKWIDGCRNCKQKSEYPSSILLDQSKKNWKLKKFIFSSVNDLTIVTPSLWLANLVKESFLCKYNTVVVNNGINTDVFKYRSNNFKELNGIENKKIILGVASIWDKRKGLNDFIELSQNLCDDYVIVLVGLSNKQVKNLPDNIIGIEHTNSVQELVDIYSAADILFNPTYEDNYPTVNLEAQACGTPVITYNTGGSPESVPAKNTIKEKDFRLFKTLLNEDLEILSFNDSYKTMIEQYIEIFEQ